MQATSRWKIFNNFPSYTGTDLFSGLREEHSVENESNH